MLENWTKPYKNIGLYSVMGFKGFARVRANPFLECRDNQQTRSCFFVIDVRHGFLKSGNLLLVSSIQKRTCSQNFESHHCLYCVHPPVMLRIKENRNSKQISPLTTGIDVIIE